MNLLARSMPPCFARHIIRRLCARGRLPGQALETVTILLDFTTPNGCR
jgi:hypothetical protein